MPPGTRRREKRKMHDAPFSRRSWWMFKKKKKNGSWRKGWLFTRERDDGVHCDWLHRLSVGRDHGEGMAFERDLRWTNWSKRVDQSKTITTTGSYGEHLEWRVRHETGVGILRTETSQFIRFVSFEFERWSRWFETKYCGWKFLFALSVSDDSKISIL